jgi:four helix bundle protein
MYEVQTQLEIAELLGFLTKADYEEVRQQADAVGRMLNGMIAKFRETIQKSAA